MSFRSFPFGALVVLATAVLLLPSCEPGDENDGPVVNPTIVFVTDSGYTHQSDTVSLADTLLVGVVINKGDDPMHTFKVQVSYDGHSAATTTDSLPIGSSTFEFDKTIITRDVAGTEKWSFVVVENDGDQIKRALTFTTE